MVSREEQSMDTNPYSGIVWLTTNWLIKLSTSPPWHFVLSDPIIIDQLIKLSCFNLYLFITEFSGVVSIEDEAHPHF